MKILFVVEHFYPYIGGVETLFFALGKELVAQNHEVIVVTTRYTKSLPSSETVAGIKVQRIKAGNRFAFTLLAMPAVWRAARHADIIHTTSYNAAFPAWVAGKMLRKPVIITFHEVWGTLWSTLPGLSSWQRWAFYNYEKWLLKLSFSQFIAVSKATADALRTAGVDEQRITTIYNGIDYARLQEVGFADNPFKRPTFLFVGRLGVSKGLDLLIPAWAMVKEQYPDFDLQLIVPRYPKARWRWLKQQIQRHRLDQHLSVVHALPEAVLYQYMKHAYAIIIPSYSEGFCFVAAEAVALGVPLVHSGRGALPEVAGGKTIRMEEQGVQGLVHAIHQAIANKWEHLPEESFPVATAVAQYMTCYERAIKNSGH